MSAPNSICPANWRLPTSGPDNEVSGSFAYLLKQYGVNQYVNSAAAAAAGAEGGIGTNGLSYDIALAPLFFVRSGDVYQVDQSGYMMSVAGLWGHGWSSRASTSDPWRVGVLSFSSDAVRAIREFAYTGGIPLRCLVVGKV